jgi:hypothetical protein
MRLEELQGMSVTTEQMNDLQTAGIISDLAVTWSDVAEIDRPAALAFLRSSGQSEEQSDLQAVKTPPRAS